jgi:TRAP transporter TAXI family solute receptor
MNRRWLWAIACLLVLAAGTALTASWLGERSPAGPATPIVLATGDAGSLSEAYGQALAGADPAHALRTRSTAGSLANLRLLEEQQAGFAFASGDAVADYLAQHPDSAIRAVARLYDSHLQVVVPVERSVHTLADLRGLRVAVGSPESGTALIADRALSAAGLDPHADIIRVELDLREAALALAADDVDALFLLDAMDAPVLTDLALRSPVRVLDLADVASRLRQDHGPVYQVGDLPARGYSALTTTITTVSVPTLLLSTTAVDGAAVERFARLLFDTATELAETFPAVGQVDRHAAIFTGPVALHDGARTYYRATKFA